MIGTDIVISLSARQHRKHIFLKNNKKLFLTKSEHSSSFYWVHRFVVCSNTLKGYCFFKCSQAGLAMLTPAFFGFLQTWIITHCVFGHCVFTWPSSLFAEEVFFHSYYGTPNKAWSYFYNQSWQELISNSGYIYKNRTFCQLQTKAYQTTHCSMFSGRRPLIEENTSKPPHCLC